VSTTSARNATSLPALTDSGEHEDGVFVREVPDGANSTPSSLPVPAPSTPSPSTATTASNRSPLLTVYWWPQKSMRRVLWHA